MKMSHKVLREKIKEKAKSTLDWNQEDFPLIPLKEVLELLGLQEKELREKLKHHNISADDYNWASTRIIKEILGE